MITAHYPSWGFETLAAQPLDTPLQKLIPPHGDLKLSKMRTDLAAQLTHYPSWGFET